MFKKFFKSVKLILSNSTLLRRIGITFAILLVFKIGTFITVPFYMEVFGGEVVYNMVGATIPSIDSVWELVLIGITPFNVVKGIAVSLVGYYTWKAFAKVLK